MTKSQERLSRRALIAGSLGLVISRPASSTSSSTHRHGQGDGALPQDEAADSVAKLSKPWLAGRPRARVEDADNDPFIISIEHRIKCNCGCAHSLYACRTTDFSCGFWQPLHAQVVGWAEQGMSAEEIIDAYVADHGTQYLMAPPPRGFNLAGYFVPGVLISLAAATLALVLRRRTKLSLAPATSDVDTPVLSAAEQARLAAELEKLEQ